MDKDLQESDSLKTNVGQLNENPPNIQETIKKSITILTNNNDLQIIGDDNQARFEQIFKITTPHSSRSYSIPNSAGNTYQNSENGEDNPPSSTQNIPSIKNESIEENEENEENDAVQLALKNLLISRQIPPENVQPQVLRALKTLILNSLIEEDYDRAKQLEDLLKYVSDNYESQANQTLRNMQAKAIENRISLAYEILNKKNAEWDDIFIMFKDDQKKRRFELDEKLANQQKMFESYWSNPNNLIMFNKPSPKLLELKKQQKILAITKNFEGAKQVKKMAEDLQIIETKEAQKRAVAAMKIQYQKLIDDQNREIDCFNEHEKRIEVFMKAERHKAIDPQIMLIRQLETIRDKDKPLNKKPRKVVFVSNRRTRTLRTETALPPASPRTSRAMSNFRFAEEPERLQITGINVKKEIRSKMSGRSQRSKSSAGSVRVSKVWR